MNVSTVEAVAQLLEGHGVALEVTGELIKPLDVAHTVDVALEDERAEPGLHAVDLVIGVNLADGRRLLENFAGLGDTRDAAVSDAFANFMQTSLHVLTALLFKVPSGHIRAEEWDIGGAPRTVFYGAYTQRTDATEELPHVEWFPVLEAAIRKRAFPPGPHWVRLFYASHKGKMLANEFMIDNQPWPEAAALIAALDWPPIDAFYSVRFFLGLDDKRE